MKGFSGEISFGQVWIDEYGNELKVVSVRESEVKLVVFDGFIITRDVFYLLAACEYKGEFNEQG